MCAHQTGNPVGRCTYLAHHELESNFVVVIIIIIIVINIVFFIVIIIVTVIIIIIIIIIIIVVVAIIMGAAGCCMAFPETGLCLIGGIGSRWTTMEYPSVQVYDCF